MLAGDLQDNDESLCEPFNKKSQFGFGGSLRECIECIGGDAHISVKSDTRYQSDQGEVFYSQILDIFPIAVRWPILSLIKKFV